MDRLLDGLIAWSIRSRTAVLLGAVLLVAGGVWSAARAPLDALPDFMPPRVVVQTEAPGLGTKDVEELVTGPLERVLLGTPTATTVRSTSSSGLSVVTLFFEEQTDVYRARQLVAERLELARTRLPQVAKPPQMAPIVAPLGALLKLCITHSGGDAKETARALRAFGDWVVRPRLLAIPGVAQVTVHGGEVERIEIRPDPVRMRARGVALAELSAAVRESQTFVGAGFVDGETVRLDVRGEARLTLAEAVPQLRGTVVKVAGGIPVLLADVAEIVRADEPRVGAAIYDRKPAVYLQVAKLPGADTMAATERVEGALRDLERTLPPGARFEPPVFRQADFVHHSLRSVGRAMGIGSLLVVFVLIVFFRSGRLAAISLTAIPLSILTAVFVLVSLGASINAMTLAGLAIAVGEVVDDAIVDVENVWRRLRENAKAAVPQPALDVVREASHEVRGSVVYATIIVGIVLIPVLSLGGISGRIFSPLAQAYILAIAASLVVALVVTPALCAWLLPRIATPEARLTGFARWLLRAYQRLLRRVVGWPKLVLGSTLLATVLAVAALFFLGGRFLPELREQSLIVHLHPLPGTSLEETLRLSARVDAQVRPAVAPHVAARAGRAELDEDAAPAHRAEMDLVLRPDEDREWDEVVADVRRRIAAVPGVGFAVEGFLGERIHEILAGETAPLVVKLLGAELSVLRRLASEAARILQTVPELASVRTEPQIDVPQLQLRLDRTALARVGLRPGAVLDAVVAARQGRSLAQILETDGRIVDVAVAGPPSFRERGALAGLPVPTVRGGSVALGELARIETALAPAVVNREAGVRRITVSAEVRGGALSGAAAKVEERLAAELRLPEGYRVEVAGEAAARREAGLRLLFVGALVLLGIFIVLAIAFSSVSDAAIVLINVPLGLVGGVAGALLLPEGLSVAAFVGFVTLFGIIARNGVMLVSHKQHLDRTEPALPAVERVLRAAEERLVPVVMTAATAFLGLLPLALSLESAGSELESSMAVIVCSGLVTSTILNMLVLPTLYVWLARRRRG